MDRTTLSLTPSHLDSMDQQLLMAHASGMTNRQIAAQLGTDMATVNQLNVTLQRKLDAKSLPHAIAQAFLRGILAVKASAHTIEGQSIARTLCLCLLLLTSLPSVDSELTRTRSPVRNQRNSNTIMRVVRAGRNKEIDV